jgi:potassium/chloride transporter 4/5/6
MNSMAGEQAHAIDSPRDGEDVGITIGCPKVDFWPMCTK